MSIIKIKYNYKVNTTNDILNKITFEKGTRNKLRWVGKKFPHLQNIKSLLINLRNARYLEMKIF